MQKIIMKTNELVAQAKKEKLQKILWYVHLLLLMEVEITME
jgi:hypothetical protein